MYMQTILWKKMLSYFLEIAFFIKLICSFAYVHPTFLKDFPKSHFILSFA